MQVKINTYILQCFKALTIIFFLILCHVITILLYTFAITIKSIFKVKHFLEQTHKRS
jgi:hypothetical protein